MDAINHRKILRLLLAATALAAVALACSLPDIDSLVERFDRPTKEPIEDLVERLIINGGGDLQVQPGWKSQMKLGTMECCVYFQEAEKIDAEWSVSPAEGASIDRDSGLLTVDEDVPHGAVYTVTADVEDGMRQIIAKVFVYDPAYNPLVGTWSEAAQLDCASGAEVDVEERIGEFIIKANGDFLVTWHPFEVYHDYSGTYAFDLDAGTLQLTVEGGSIVPSDVDGEGTFAVDAEGRLVLRDIWLGTYNAEQPVNCGHIFERY